jgi:hypothetical protein
MKFKIHCAAAVTLLLCAFTNPASPETDILGQWKFDDATVNKTVKKLVASITAGNPAATQQVEGSLQSFKELAQGIRVTFKADHTFETQTPQGIQKGKWLFTNNNTFLQLDRENTATRKDSLLEISATRIKVVNNKQADTIIYVRP